MSYLDELESESIYIIREVMGQFRCPVILFSGGKDSVVMTHLAKKAVWPMGLEVLPLMHIDTGHNFKETLEYRDWFVKEMGGKLVVKGVQETIDRGLAVDEQGFGANRNAIQSVTLIEGIKALGVDCALGGGRRDEEKARAKERIFSHRNDEGKWQPHNQRPELWDIYNGRHKEGEHFRVFPLSNWTESDVWEYVRREGIKLPGMYYAHERRVFERDGVWVPVSEHMQMKSEEVVRVVVKQVRFRTVGDARCSGVVESDADTVDKVINEIKKADMSERGNRVDDKRSEAAMEERKLVGYF